MLVYASTKSGFIEDVNSDSIDEKILASFRRHLGQSAAGNEVRSWRNSMLYMREVLRHDDIPSDAGVAIEFTLPQSRKRIDFILSGKNASSQATVVIVELKQWESAKATNMDGVVRTFVGKGERDVTHPSYQAWTYAALLQDFNEAVQSEQIDLRACAYLHNCANPDVVRDSFYKPHTDRAPVFIRRESQKLAEFISQHVKHGDACETMYRIDNGRIRPSKNLADALSSLLAGNQEFVLIDDQKLVFETALSLALKSTVKDKHVLIVDGGPGTGKSVVAINLLSRLTQEGLLAQFVSKNAAPREVYHAKLTGSAVATRFKNLFKGSGSFTTTEKNLFDALIVDEAHRLNEKSGLYQNQGENQIKEIIEASKFSVFFIDEDQRVTLKDIGTRESIMEWARSLGATIHRQELQSQFRCNGSDGYLAWVDNTLGLRPTANPSLENVDYDFRVFDSPNDLREAIVAKNNIRNRARIVAGYCWEWTSRTDSSAMDVVIPEYNFAMKWNLAGNANLWIIRPDSVDEIGCIHTCQGLETDYVGVIIGPDLIVRNGRVITDGTKRAKADASIKGFKQMLKEYPERARREADMIIKNTYRTLMTRGMKGCYVFCTDEETNQWLKAAAGSQALARANDNTSPTDNLAPELLRRSVPEGLSLKLVSLRDVRPFVNAVPLYDLKIAAGLFSDTQLAQEWIDGSELDASQCRWVELPDAFRIKPGQFVAQVVGESMNRRIPNGSWCLFNLNPGGTRQGKVVLAQHRHIEDPEIGGQYTIKVYRSEKRETSPESWEHTRIILAPDSDDDSFEPMVFEASRAAELRIIAELVAVLT